MRSISVVGAGQAGLIFAHLLLRKGYDVTVYSDRTPDQWLNDFAPTGTAFLYANTIAIEAEAGLDHWSGTMYGGEGILLDFCPVVGAEPMVARGRLPAAGGAVDQRLKNHRWLLDFEDRGGKIVYQTVTLEGADEIAAGTDLLVIAAGKGELARLIPRDAGRSVYDKPQRNLSMVIAGGVGGWSGRAGFTPVKFNFFGDAGEFFWVPYTHKTAGHVWCGVFEAKAGGPMDRFGDCRDGHQVIERAKEVMRDLAPWEMDSVKDMELADDDPHAWLVGRFPPTVRQGFGKLPSGRLAIPLGDTAIAFDPIGGQGGNTATRNAKYTAEAVIARAGRPFDEDWATGVNQGFWKAHGWGSYTFNNLLLEPLTEAGQLVLACACQSDDFATEHFFGNFPTPNNFFPWFDDLEKAREITAPYMAAAEPA